MNAPPSPTATPTAGSTPIAPATIPTTPAYTSTSASTNSNSLTSAAADEEEARPPPTKRRKNLAAACAECSEAHTACSDTRPCTRCKKKNLKCYPRQSKRKGAHHKGLNGAASLAPYPYYYGDGMNGMGGPMAGMMGGPGGMYYDSMMSPYPHPHPHAHPGHPATHPLVQPQSSLPYPSPIHYDPSGRSPSPMPVDGPMGYRPQPAHGGRLMDGRGHLPHTATSQSLGSISRPQGPGSGAPKTTSPLVPLAQVRTQMTLPSSLSSLAQSSAMTFVFKIGSQKGEVTLPAHDRRLTSLIALIKSGASLPPTTDILLAFKRNGDRVLVHAQTDMDMLAGRELEVFSFKGVLST